MIVVLSKASLLVGAFSAILLLFIIQPVHGWVALLLWILYSLKTVYELINIGTFYRFLEKLRNAVSGQSEDYVPPVSVSV